MKKLVNPLSTGGAPLYSTETFSEILTKEVWDALEGLFKSLTPSKYNPTFVTTDNVVISGGEITDLGGGNFDVAAGIAYFKSAGGIIARFPAASSSRISNERVKSYAHNRGIELSLLIHFLSFE